MPQFPYSSKSWFTHSSIDVWVNTYLKVIGASWQTDGYAPLWLGWFSFKLLNCFKLKQALVYYTILRSIQVVKPCLESMASIHRTNLLCGASAVCSVQYAGEGRAESEQTYSKEPFPNQQPIETIFANHMDVNVYKHYNVNNSLRDLRRTY